jgi:hypothetical protein
MSSSQWTMPSLPSRRTPTRIPIMIRIHWHMRRDSLSWRACIIFGRINATKPHNGKATATNDELSSSLSHIYNTLPVPSPSTSSRRPQSARQDVTEYHRTSECYRSLFDTSAPRTALFPHARTVSMPGQPRSLYASIRSNSLCSSNLLVATNTLPALLGVALTRCQVAPYLETVYPFSSRQFGLYLWFSLHLQSSVLVNPLILLVNEITGPLPIASAVPKYPPIKIYYLDHDQ